MPTYWRMLDRATTVCRAWPPSSRTHAHTHTHIHTLCKPCCQRLRSGRPRPPRRFAAGMRGAAWRVDRRPMMPHRWCRRVLVALVATTTSAAKGDVKVCFAEYMGLIGGPSRGDDAVGAAMRSRSSVRCAIYSRSPTMCGYAIAGAARCPGHFLGGHARRPGQGTIWFRRQPVETRSRAGLVE